MTRRKQLTLAATLMFLGPSVLTSLGQVTADTSEWKADPAAAKRLGSAVKRDEFGIQIPRNFEEQKPTIKPLSKKQVWVGPPRSEMGRPVLSISRFTVNAELVAELKKSSLETILEPLLLKQSESMTGWNQEPIESGTVNGRNWARVRWSGNSTQTRQDIRGFFYITKMSDGFFHLTGQDNAPTSAKTLPVIEAAVLSFRVP